PQTQVQVKKGGELFTIKLEATQDMRMSEVFRVVEDRIRPEAYVGGDFKIHTITLGLRADESQQFEALSMSQNEPNPWYFETNINFNLPSDGNVELRVKDVTGRSLFRTQKKGSRGPNSIQITKNEVAQTGVLIYEIEFNGQVVNRKMIHLE